MACECMRDEIGNKGLRDLIAHVYVALNKNSINMVEVGSYSGESTKVFLDTEKVGRIYCIDPWENITGNGFGNDYLGMEAVEAAFDERVGRDSRVVKRKGELSQYLGFCWEALDFVYIDAIHTYEACKQDILNTIKCLKPKVIGGHDYNDQLQHTAGVKKAVDEIFGSPDKVFCDTSWVKRLSWF